MANRTGKGGFKPGQSGNPGGRAKLSQELRDRALKAVDDVIMAAWLDEVETRGPNWAKCSELIAAYGLGKPTQPVTGEDGGAIEVAARVIILPDNGRGDGPKA